MTDQTPPPCPVCGQTDEVEALSAVYKAAVPKLSFTLRPPTGPEPPVLLTPVEVPPHPDEPEAPYQNRSAVNLTLRGLIPLLASMTACSLVLRLMANTSFIYADILFSTVLWFVAGPLSLIALAVTGAFVYRWARYNVIDATYNDRLREHILAVEENERRAEENERINARHAEVQAAHEEVAYYWDTLYTCHRDKIVFDPATGEHHPREAFREAML